MEVSARELAAVEVLEGPVASVGLLERPRCAVDSLSFASPPDLADNNCC